MKSRILKKWHCAPGCLVLFAVAAILFSLYPQADLEFSNLFYAGHGYFPANDWWIVKAVYHGTPWLGRLFFFIAIAASLLAIVKPTMISRRHWRRAAAVFSIVILGIGLVVHVFLKDGMGHPRPSQFWFLVGLKVGGLIGLVRIMQDGHFLSEVVFSLVSIWANYH